MSLPGLKENEIKENTMQRKVAKYNKASAAAEEYQTNHQKLKTKK